MKRETKNFPFTFDEFIAAMGHCAKAQEIEFLENRKGCGRDSEHNYYYVLVGNTEFSDGGRHTYGYTFAKAVADLLKTFGQQLEERHLHLRWKTEWFTSGYDCCWHSHERTQLSVPCEVVSITPCKEFTVLQKWVRRHAEYDLGLFDLFSADICRKNGSATESGHCYLATNAWLCIENMKKIKTTYKQGNIVKAEIRSSDSYDSGYDRGREDYEQYGERYTTMVLTFATPTGRNERKLCVGRYV